MSEGKYKKLDKKITHEKFSAFGEKKIKGILKKTTNKRTRAKLKEAERFNHER